jgi:iron complex outermembrane receptor protein
MNINTSGPTVSPIDDLAESPPKHSFNLRSSHQISNSMTLDWWLRYTDDLEKSDIEGYTAFDLRLAWQLSPAIEISLTGQNLFDSQHQEFSVGIIPTTDAEMKRSVYGKIVWVF